MTLQTTKDFSFLRLPDGMWLKISEFEDHDFEDQYEDAQPRESIYSEDELEQLKEFNDCLAENGMVIYGSDGCPACRNLIETMGGHNSVESLYVESSRDSERFSEEAKTGYVPEIQINGELYEGARTLEAFGEATGCGVPDLN